MINEEEQILQLKSDSSGKLIKKPLASEQQSNLAIYFDQRHHDKLLGEEKDKLELRKRSGELDLTGSEGDTKRLVIKHWLLYIIIVLSVFTLVAITVSKINSFNHLSSSYQNVVKTY